MLREQRVQNFRPVAEICCLEARNGSAEFDQSAAGGQIEYAQGSGNGETAPTCYGDPSAIVDEDKIGTQRPGKRQRDRRYRAPAMPDRH